MLEDKHDLQYKEILKRMDKNIDKRYEMYCNDCKKYVPFLMSWVTYSQSGNLECGFCLNVLATIREKGESE